MKTIIIKKYKPVTPGFRNKVGLCYNYLEKKRFPFLLSSLKRSKYINTNGNLVNYNRQFGHKKLYRLIDFKRNFIDIVGTVVGFNYDPNRNTNLALIRYENGTMAFILDIDCLYKNDKIISTQKYKSILNLGDSLILKYIPIGTYISNIEKNPGTGAIYLRSAGTYGLLFQKNNNIAKVQFKSGIIKEFSINCKAIIGKVSGFEQKFVKIGKAGINRWKGRRPIVRGVAKNPVDHPHGGGNGKTSGGRPSVSR